jgi:hypothetical protein
LTTAAVFRVTDVWYGNITNIRMYFNVGLPAGNMTMFNTGVLLTPKFVGLLINVGSPGGSKIVLNVQGIGSKDTVPEVRYKAGEAWNKLCTVVSIIGYGKVECVTKTITIAQPTPLKITLASVDYECVHADTTKCMYSQADSTMPKVTSASISDPETILFTGTDFPTTGYTANATFGGVKANSVEIVSAISVKAKWTTGVPVVMNATTPQLYFWKNETFPSTYTTPTTGTGSYSGSTSPAVNSSGSDNGSNSNSNSESDSSSNSNTNSDSSNNGGGRRMLTSSSSSVVNDKVLNYA